MKPNLVLAMLPDGWSKTLAQCQPGPFAYEDRLGFKSEYTENGKILAYNAAGEFFSMPPDTIVQPVSPEWREEEA